MRTVTVITTALAALNAYAAGWNVAAGEALLAALPAFVAGALLAQAAYHPVVGRRERAEREARRAAESSLATARRLSGVCDRFRAENDRLRSERDRLREGRFTEEEFQGLCHNFSPDDLCRFRRGCEEYQRKLFGFAPPEDEQERQALKARYAGQVEACCECGEDYPKADLIIDGDIYCPKCRAEEK